jgi:hypothetical protein
MSKRFFFSKWNISKIKYCLSREDGVRELGARFPKAGDALPRIFIAKHCVNLIGELLECIKLE